MRVLWSIAAVAALLVLAQPLAAQTPPDPIVKTEWLRQVSPHVYIIPDNSVPLVPNVGFVIGERGVLVIDTGLGPRNGSAVLEVAKKLGGSRRSRSISSPRISIRNTISARRPFPRTPR